MMTSALTAAMAADTDHVVGFDRPRANGIVTSSEFVDAKRALLDALAH